jgi:hypothetical protein
LFTASTDHTVVERAAEEVREDRNDFKTDHLGFAHAGTPHHPESLKSSIQIPEAFRQFHVDPALFEVDSPEIGMGKRNQRFLFVTIDLENPGVSGLHHIRHLANVLAASGKDTATFQLKCIKPALSRIRQVARAHSNLCPDVFFGFGDAVFTHPVDVRMITGRPTPNTRSSSSRISTRTAPFSPCVLVIRAIGIAEASE